MACYLHSAEHGFLCPAAVQVETARVSWTGSLWTQADCPHP